MSRTFVFLSAVGLTLAIAGTTWAEGNVLFEYWMNIGGTGIGDLTNNGAFPWGPDSSEYLPDLKSKVDWADNTGTRARSYLVPPETGEYTFWVSGDDACQLWLSTDDTAANAKLIATVNSWTPVETWNWEANQMSSPVALQAGQKYYVEMLMKEGGGGDSITAAWGGPGIGDGPVVITGQYLSLFVETRRPAYSPVPANGAVDITNPLLQWTPGKTAAAHNVYFGTNPEPGEAEFVGQQPFNLYFVAAGLTPGAKYFWRVDELEADGVTVHTGDVWSFTAMPVKAYDQSPYDGAIYRNLDTVLSWKAGFMAQSHDVYFSTSKEDVETGAAGAFKGNLVVALFNPGGLALGTTYFWRVDEIQSGGNKIVGDVLTFNSMLEGFGAAKLEVWNDIGGIAVSDLTNDPRYPGAPDSVAEVPNFEIPADTADYYGAKLSAWLTVPVAGDYTFWVASDDASQLFLGADQFSAVQIAEVTGWTASRAWDWNASQKSAPIHLEEGKYYIAALLKEGSGGDNLSAAWQGPAVPQRELIGGGFLQPYIALWADGPRPADGAVDVLYLTSLAWSPGVKAAAHNVYLGTDKNAVANATPDTAGIFQGQVTDPTFTPAPLAWNKTYYWRIDEVNDAEADSPWKGTIWSFSVPDYLPVLTEPETVAYDNTAEPFVSEAAFEYETPQNWTVNGITSLQLEIKGGGPKYSFNPDGSVTLNGAGADIWGTADEFRYAYKTLTGDGSIVARVAAIGDGSNAWAKGGVMVRETLDANSKHMIMALTGGEGGGIAFQGRPETGGNSSSFHGDVIAAAPYWVKLTREGNAITAYFSADGVEWTLMTDASPDNGGGAMSNPINLAMAETVHIGLFVTSHAAGELRSYTFDNVALTGNVSADWQLADVGVAQGGNDPAPLFITLFDKDGKSAKVAHPGNPDVVFYADWTQLKILLSKFAGVDLKAITKVVLSVGDGKPDGSGSIQVDNVRVVKPIQVAVENPSFEKPGAVQKWFAAPRRVVGFDTVPGWKTAKKVVLSGVIPGLKPTAGSWSAYLWGSESPIFQTTGHTIVEGEMFQLDVDAGIVMGAINEKVKNFKMTLYYLDGTNRVAVATTTVFTPGSQRKYSLTFSSADARKAVGHQIGIELANVAKNNLMSLDNVRLATK